MASPASDDLACFDSLPDDLVGVIMGKLNLKDSLRLTQACPTARRLVQGERAVPGVLGKVFVGLFDVNLSQDLRIAVSKWGFRIQEVGTTTDEEEDAERQPSANIFHLLEWIRVRARAFTEIEVDLKASIDRSILDHITDTFLPNVPSSYRGKISFVFDYTSVQGELAHLPNFLAKWRALAPAYECGLMLRCRDAPSDLLRSSFRAAPPLSLFDLQGFEHGEILDSLDTSRLTKLEIDTRSWTLESLPSNDVLFPTLRDLHLGLSSECWSSLDAFLAPLHRLTALNLQVGTSHPRLDPPLTLAPFTVLPNLRLLQIRFTSLVPPPVGSDYWKDPVVLPALKELYLFVNIDNDLDAPRGQGGPAAGQPPRWPTLLSNLEAPKLERLDYRHKVMGDTHYRTLDLPLGRFPRLRFFDVSASGKALFDLPALRAEIATLRHLKWPAGLYVGEVPVVKFYTTSPVPVPEEEVKAWERELGFRIRCTCESPSNYVGGRLVNFKVELFPS